MYKTTSEAHDTYGQLYSAEGYAIVMKAPMMDQQTNSLYQRL